MKCVAFCCLVSYEKIVEWFSEKFNLLCFIYTFAMVMEKEKNMPPANVCLEKDLKSTPFPV